MRWVINATNADCTSSLGNNKPSPVTSTTVPVRATRPSQNPSNLHFSPVLASLAECELGIGVVFRCRSDDDYYRSFMDSAASCRRLVRRIAGTFTTQPGVGAGAVAAEKAKELPH